MTLVSRLSNSPRMAPISSVSLSIAPVLHHIRLAKTDSITNWLDNRVFLTSKNPSASLNGLYFTSSTDSLNTSLNPITSRQRVALISKTIRIAEHRFSLPTSSISLKLARALKLNRIAEDISEFHLQFTPRWLSIPNFINIAEHSFSSATHPFR